MLLPLLLLYANHYRYVSSGPVMPFPFNVSCRIRGCVERYMRNTYRYTRLREVMALWHTGHTSTWAAQLPQNTCLQRVSKSKSQHKLGK
jgi:hypothetical protein